MKMKPSVDLKIDVKEAQDLKNKYGTPLFIVHESQLEKDYEAFESAFKSLYSNTEIGYSIKTNYLSWICQKLFKLGAVPEFICGFELSIGVFPHVNICCS